MVTTTAKPETDYFVVSVSNDVEVTLCAASASEVEEKYRIQEEEEIRKFWQDTLIFNQQGELRPLLLVNSRKFQLPQELVHKMSSFLPRQCRHPRVKTRHDGWGAPTGAHSWKTWEECEICREELRIIDEGYES
jgi:hypothetical protein